MDFFDHQERARKKTGRLVFLFMLAVAGIAVALYLLAVALFGYASAQEVAAYQQPTPFSWLRFDIMAGVVLFTSVLVGGAASFRISQLRGGGKSVAESLGGRLLDSGTTDRQERQLLNVVEEVAIASGVSVPPVYVMWDEMAINAFAAGFSPRDAVIGVTRGCMEQLDRNELQGVIAHEFSHILNGDMRLNIRLMGVLFGISFITLTGYYLARSIRFVRSSKNNPAGAILAFGVGLMVVGWIGSLFASLIRAAVSRQREFLADASAVQFTRYPAGIGGALMKIGGFGDRARLKSARAAECSHMFFGNALKLSFLNLWSTHPPLEDRLKAIDPRLDLERAGSLAGVAAASESGAALGFSSLRESGRMRVSPEQMVASVGRPTTAHHAYAGNLLDSLDSELKRMARDPLGARAIAYGLLFDQDPATAARQLGLVSREDPLVLIALDRARERLTKLNPTDRLPLLDLAIPELRSMSQEQRESFQKAIEGLVRADLAVNLFEFALMNLLERHLHAWAGRVTPRQVRHTTLRTLSQECRVILSGLAYVGSENAAQAENAYQVGADQIEWGGAAGAPPLMPQKECGLVRMGDALSALEGAAPRAKRRFLSGCVATVTTDGQVTAEEAELMRAIADGIDCPMPPLIG